MNPNNTRCDIRGHPMAFFISNNIKKGDKANAYDKI